MRYKSLVAVLLLLLLGYCNHKVGAQLTPPYFNLAQNKVITATATCGVDTPEPELYCQLVGANSETEDSEDNIIQGQQCDLCDVNDEKKRHPPEYAIDDAETWWQSPPLSRGKKYEQVNLTINLGQEFHVAYIYIKMGNSPRPGLWVLEKSKDYGKTYTPWQYYSESENDCITYFGIEGNTQIERDDSVTCTTEYSKIVPLEGGEIPFSSVKSRPSANHYFNSTVLQEWTRATNVRFRFLKTKTLYGHLMSLKRQDPTVTRRYFYSIKDIQIGGRCMCNGHAKTCDALDPNQPNKLFCQCQDNTCGAECTTCCKGYEQKKWRQSTHLKSFVCEPCNCFGHSDECIYDAEIDESHASLDIYGNYEGGGVCQDCKHNTEGINCNKCKPKFYRPANKPLNATDVCQPCDCDRVYSTGNCFDVSGQCECKPEYTAPNCDSCSYGYFGYPDCRPCECHLNRTEGYHCEATEGQCPCKANFAGDYCEYCAEEYYDFPNCLECNCSPIGTLDNLCDVLTGQCKCKSEFGGRRCEVCEDGYYNYPKCEYCDCDTHGTEPGVCDKTSGVCLCKEGYGGPRCDQCLNGYFSYPNCEPCNCSKNGSVAISCDVSGKCSCLSNFVGRTCNQCGPGFHNYPDCIACNCDYHGSIGVSCDHEGKCQCHSNFDGDRCDKCKDQFYNYPSCEGCNCDPAGIAGTFQGCGSLPIGELCQCKDRVEGRICNQCKKLFWNLQSNNPDGCQDCLCNIPGVIGGIGECDGKTGQCICKPSVTSRDCSVCTDGTYNLQESNLFGCSECACDVGGSIHPTCNKVTGQCQCRSRIEGPTCSQPMRTQYFPTLHQLQYEAEDGHTPTSRPVRFGFGEDIFPGYSWKGYAQFSTLQDKTIHDIDIFKSSLYRMVIRYVNKNNEPILGSVIITPESNFEAEQNFKVQFKPNNGKPSFVTVAGVQGNLPSVMVMNPGRWTITLNIERNLFVDYFVLLPSEYYEASILTQEVNTPCTVGYKSLCRHFAYPNLSPFDSVLGTGGYIGDESSRKPLTQFLDDENTLDGGSLAEFFDDPNTQEGQMPLLNKNQNKIHFELRVTKPGPHVLVITYITPPKEENHISTIFVQANNLDKGKATLHPCKYTSVCRQVVTEINNKVANMNFPNNYVTIVLDGEPNTNVAIKSIVAIPSEEWSVDYLAPKSVCVRNNGKCIQGVFPEASDAKKIELEQYNNFVDSAITPDGIYDNSSKFIYLDDKNSPFDVPAKVPHPGDYVFVLQYHQPDHPEFDLDVLLQNGIFYEAKAPVPHCPSNSGCRSLIRQQDGNTNFTLVENFVISLKDNTDKGIWLDYILVVPADLYHDGYLKKQQFDQTKEFIKKCGTNHFHMNSTEEGFCRNSVFSLTTNFNNGALPCSCDVEGAMSFECEKFGGQCPCKPNIIGRRCNICKTGFYGFPNCRPCNCPSVALCDAENGACICPDHVVGERCDQCEEGTFGYDQIIGCEECNCHPHGVLNGTIQCDLLTGHCQCKDNVVERDCSRCKAGHYSFPYCDKCDCDIRGTTKDICDQKTSDCICKENAQGAACDFCKEGMFNLQPTNEKGCSQCFCFGKTTRCNSANLFKTYLTEMTGWDVALVNEKNETVEILKTIPQELNETHILVDMSGISDTSIVYLSAPASYLNKKLTSYGGWLNFTFYYTTGPFGQAIPGADIILQGADTFLMYRNEEQPPSRTEFFSSVELVESNFETKKNSKASREQLMLILNDLRGIYIRATYWQPTLTATLSQVTLDVTIESYIANSEVASSVEQCQCPPNYRGLSCEECAKGYYRVPGGPYGGSCVKCQCNGHADTCDVNTGVCFDCRNGTTGDHCEFCQEGYYGNATVGTPSDCLICACPLPIPSNNFATGCEVSEDGSRISCECKKGYYGARCESCAAGFFGKPDVIDDVCKPCDCSGNINTNEIDSCDSVSGECLKCLNNTYGTACNLCAPGFFGDAVERKDCKSCYCDQCGMKRCDNRNGLCECRDNVIGDKCDRCKDDHYGFSSCQGCQACNCGIASESTQCADDDGKCKCKPGVEGRTCDQCMAGFWKYGPEGCISCNCTSGYSRGASCNPETGQCECLPGVLGEKCDHCPHRTVLDERRGCQTCDKCTHDLLDVTDELGQKLNPVANSFKNVADSYFTNQRLDFINDTLVELEPEVKLLDPRRIDFNPLKEKINKLTQNAFGLKRRVEYQEEDGEKVSADAEQILRDMNDFDQHVGKEISVVNSIINEVQMLALNTEPSSGQKIDNPLKKAQAVLDSIKNISFTAARDKATDQANQANILVSEMATYSEPVQKLEQDTEDVNSKVRDIGNQIDDMYNWTLQADELANTAERLNFENKKLSDANTLSNVKNTADQVNQDLTKSEELNKKASDMYNEALYNFSNLQNDVNTGTASELSQQLDKRIKDNDDSLNEIKSEVSRAIAHADDLNARSIQIENVLTPTRNFVGVKAASVFQNIADNIIEARRSAEDAMKAADNATNLATGLEDRSNSLKGRSEQLLNKASDAVSNVANQLKPLIENAQVGIIPKISELNDENLAKLDIIDKALKDLPAESTSMLAQEVLNNVDTVEYTVGQALNNHVNKNANKIPEDLKKTKQLSKDTSDSIRDISQANHQLDSMGLTLPDITNRLSALGDRQQAINSSGLSLYRNIEKLKDKIREARELANNIRIGLVFFPNTTLELKNPESLPVQSTSMNISVYFRTSKTNGFLFYLGNENKASHRGMKTHDFMALSIEGGYPVLTLDLGSGPQRIIGSRYVSDNIWRQLIVDRTGRNIKLIIREEERDGKENTFVTEHSLPGQHTIFNLDREKSKLFVGGYPPSFQVQESVVSSSFDGEMEQLMIDNVLASFWNFVDGENNYQPAMERDKLVNLQPNTGYRFDREGYAILNKTDLKVYDQIQFSVQFKFKTWINNGLMFLMSGNKQFLAIELRDGHILYQVDLGDGQIAIKSKKKYNDGNWHTVEARRYEKIGLLKVDSDTIGEDESKGDEKKLITNNFIYFGGYPTSVPPHPYKAVTQIGFEGCIDDVSLQEFSVDLTKNVRASGVTTGCPVQFPSLVSFDSVHPGYAKWHMPDVPHSLQISLKFKTQSDNGIIYQVLNPDGSVANSLTLVNGQLVLESQGERLVTNTQDIRFSDNEWHVVTATHNDSVLRVDIDDREEETKDNVAYPRMIQNGLLYVANSYNGALNAVCIGDTTINGVIVNFAETSERLNAHFQCSKSDHLSASDQDDTVIVTPPSLPISAEDDNDNLIDVRVGENNEDQLLGGSSESRLPIVPEQTPTQVTEEPTTTTTTTAWPPTPQREPETVDGCRLPQYPANDPEQYQENAHRFGTKVNSRFEYSTLKGQTKDSYYFQIDIKTVANEGLIFFSSNPQNRDLIALHIKDGVVHHTFDCGSGPAILVADKKKVNDERWHTIYFSRTGTRGRLIVDDQEPIDGESAGALMSTSVLPPYFVGGVDSDRSNYVLETIGVNKAFSGCIKNFMLNGQHVGEPSTKLDVIPCSKRVEPGMFFYPGNGSNYYKAAERFSVGRQVSIQMDIKPRSSSGLLLSVHGRNDHVVLEMVNGTVKFLVKGAKGQIETSFEAASPNALCDGNWHSIRAVKQKIAVVLSVDRVAAPVGIGKNLGGVLSKHALYIGGHPLLEAGKILRGSVSKAQYVGCIKNIIIRDEIYTFDPANAHGRVMTDVCPTI